MTIDLHVHSTFSDGSMSPADLVRYAQEKGLKALSITDHDTVDGIAEATMAGNLLGVEIVPGLELSMRHGDSSIHLLGYLFNPAEDALLKALSHLQAGRLERNQTILVKLLHLGIEISMPDLERISGHGQCGRPHIAQLLIQKGVVHNMDTAFERYLGKGASAYVPRRVLPADEAIAMIKNAGGLAVLAHPQQLEKSGKDVNAVLSQLRAVGLDGIEVHYPTHSRQFKKKLVSLAKRHDLLVTGGSDYHGSIRPGTTLAGGRNCTVPMRLLSEMKERLARKYSSMHLPVIQSRIFP